MTKVESYIKRGMSVKEMAVEFRAHCEDTKCVDCPYNTDSHACVIEFLMSEAPHDKTLKELFFEKHPYAPATASNELPVICPHQLGWGTTEDCYDDPKGCAKCWDRLCKDVLGDEEG